MINRSGIYEQIIGISPLKALQIFNISRQGSLILIAILLAQFQLSTIQLGYYEQLLFLGYLLTFFWISGLIQGFLSHFPSLSPEKQQRFIFNAFLLFSVLAAGIFTIGYLAKSLLWTTLLHQDNLPYYLLFLTYLCLNFPTCLVENYLLLEKKGFQIVRYGALAFSAQLLVMVLPIYLGWDFRYSFYGLIAVGLLKLLYLVYLLSGKANWQLDIAMIRQWLQLSSPLILYAILGGLLPAFDGWLVGFLFEGDEKMFAIFRYGAQELPLALALTNAFSNVMVVEVAKERSAALLAIKQKSVKLFHLLFPLSIFLMLASEYLFPRLFNEDFIESALVFRIYLLVIISRVVFSSTILMGLKDNNVITRIGLLELLVNVVCSCFFGYYYGVAGIALGTLIAFSLEKILQAIYLYRKHQISLKEYLDFKWFFGYSILLLLAFFLS